MKFLTGKLVLACFLLSTFSVPAFADDVVTRIVNGSDNYIVVRAKGDDKSYDQIQVPPKSKGQITIHIGVEKKVGFKFNVCGSDLTTKKPLRNEPDRLDCKELIASKNVRFVLEYGDKAPVSGGEPTCAIIALPSGGFNYGCSKGANLFSKAAEAGLKAAVAALAGAPT